jgi:nitrate reductase gamma subunit
MIDFLFQIYPYCAVIIFAALIFAQKYKSKNNQYIVDKKEQYIYDRLFRFGNNLFHWSLVLLMIGHFLGLLTPERLYTILITVKEKQILAIYIGGCAGIICFIGMTIMVLERILNKKLWVTNSVSRFVMLFMVYVQLILGLLSILVSRKHLDGSQMLDITKWLQHLVILNANAYQSLASVNFIYKLHIILGFSILLVFPFTNLVYVINLPLRHITNVGYKNPNNIKLLKG